LCVGYGVVEAIMKRSSSEAFGARNFKGVPSPLRNGSQPDPFGFKKDEQDKADQQFETEGLCVVPSSVNESKKQAIEKPKRHKREFETEASEKFFDPQHRWISQSDRPIGS
jgi:hypothetical protein